MSSRRILIAVIIISVNLCGHEAVAQEPTKSARLLLAELVKNGEGGRSRLHITGPELSQILKNEQLRIHQKIKLNGLIVRGKVDLSHFNCPFELRLEDTEFNDEVTFQGSLFASDLSLNSSHFLGPLYLTQARIGGSVWLQKVTFDDSVDLSMLQVDGTLQGQWSTYKGGKINASELRIQGGNLFLGGTTFDSGVQSVYIGGEARELLAQKTVFRSPVTIRMHVVNDIRFLETEFSKRATLDGSRIGGKLIFNGANIVDGLSLKYLKATSLLLWQMQWPEKPNALDFEGIEFSHVSFFEGNPSGLEIDQIKIRLNQLFRNIRYTLSLFSQLENYYKAQGNQSLADWIHIVQRRTERTLSPWYSFNKVSGYLLDVLTGYGRAQWRLSVIGAVFLFMGFMVFRNKEDMRPTSEDVTYYNPFLYSLDLLLPAIDLRMADAWEPVKPGRQIYLRIHIICGWLLVPTALAGLFGLLQ